VRDDSSKWIKEEIGGESSIQPERVEGFEKRGCKEWDQLKVVGGRGPWEDVPFLKIIPTVIGASGGGQRKVAGNELMKKQGKRTGGKRRISASFLAIPAKRKSEKKAL